MSIEVFVDDCKNNHELYEVDPKTGTKTLGAVPTCLGIYLNSIGIHQITPKNSEKVFLRLSMWQLAQGGGPFVKNGKNYKLTLEHVERCIGLRVNTVEQNEREFNCNLLIEMRERAQRDLARQRKVQALEARGFLLGAGLQVAFKACLKIAVGEGWSSGDDDHVDLNFAEQQLSKWGSKGWQRAFDKITPEQPWTLGHVTDANLEFYQLTVAFDLSTPLRWFLKRDRELRGEPEPVPPKKGRKRREPRK